MDCNIEILFGQMLRAIEFIWELESVGIDALVYDAHTFENSDAIFVEQINDCVNLNTLIVRALFPSDKANSTQKQSQQGSGSKKIPDALISDYLASKNSDSDASRIAAIDAFKKSLTGFYCIAEILRSIQ